MRRRVRAARLPEGPRLPALVRARQEPPNRADQRYTFVYLYGAGEPGTDNAFAFALNDANTQGMQILLDRIAEAVGANKHVVMALDQAEWHGVSALRVTDCVKLAPLPTPRPELSRRRGRGSA